MQNRPDLGHRGANLWQNEIVGHYTSAQKVQVLHLSKQNKPQNQKPKNNPNKTKYPTLLLPNETTFKYLTFSEFINVNHKPKHLHNIITHVSHPLYLKLP